MLEVKTKYFVSFLIYLLFLYSNNKHKETISIHYVGKYQLNDTCNVFLRKIKEARRRQQESNVERKKLEREDNKQRSMEGIKRKLEQEAGDAGAERTVISGMY